MLRSRFLWKLYAGFVALVLLTTMVVGFLVNRDVEKASLHEIEASLRNKATLLRHIAKPSLKTGPFSNFEKEITDLGYETRTRLTVIREGGVVIADSQEEMERMDNHGNRPEIVSAKAHGVGISTRFSRTLNEHMMYLALPVKEENKLTGFVRVSIPTTAVYKRLSRLHMIVGLGAAIAAGLALILGFFFARRITRPLTSMTDAVKSIAQGDYDKKIFVRSNDEIGSLATAYNHMADQLRDRIETITADRAKTLAILANMVEGVIAVDMDEKIVHMNRAAGEILQASLKDTVGKRVWEVTRVTDVCSTLTDAMKDRKSRTSEITILDQQKEQVIEMRASPLNNADGEVTGALVVLHDVSELRRLETVRRDFVANVSHELKTPLTAIKGLVETLIDDKEMNPDTHSRFLGKIKTQSDRLSALVTDLLTLSRLDSGMELLKKERMDLRKPVNQALQTLLPAAKARDVSFVLQLPEKRIVILGDKEALAQIVTNLVDNAIKYSPDGLSIQVSLFEEEEKEKAVLEVRDQGAGIEPAHQERIFERFYRMDRDRSRELGGTGLGLSIVKRLTLALGGEVSLESHPGEGSVFRVVLPLA